MEPIFKKYLKTIGVIWAAFLTVLLLANLFVVSPKRRELKDIKKQLAEKKQVYDAAVEAAKDETKNKLAAEIKQLKTTLDQFTVAFENAENVSFDISRIAGEKNLSSFSIGGKRQHHGQNLTNCNYIKENNININFKAGFNQFTALLSSLERHHPVIFVDKFTMVRSEKEPSGHQVSMNLSVFVRKPQGS